MLVVPTKIEGIDKKIVAKSCDNHMIKTVEFTFHFGCLDVVDSVVAVGACYCASGAGNCVAIPPSEELYSV